MRAVTHLSSPRRHARAALFVLGILSLTTGDQNFNPDGERGMDRV